MKGYITCLGWAVSNGGHPGQKRSDMPASHRQAGKVKVSLNGNAPSFVPGSGTATTSMNGGTPNGVHPISYRNVAAGLLSAASLGEVAEQVGSIFQNLTSCCCCKGQGSLKCKGGEHYITWLLYDEVNVQHMHEHDALAGFRSSGGVSFPDLNTKIPPLFPSGQACAL